MAGIYVHIPFCKQACHYCDFHFSTNQSYRHALVNALIKETVIQKDYLRQQSIDTLYFGGGTPSILSHEELTSLFQALHQNFPINPTCEVTVEANPDDLTKEKIATLKELGVNRLSIGIQTFQDELLHFLNRAHQAATASSCVKLARSAGFNNISIDLIYAIPGQTELMWQQDIDQALALNPEHISCYSLTIEPKTVFGKWSVTGKLKPIDDDISAHYLEILVNRLASAGYEHYEVSNFSKPGWESRHNSSYWKQMPYLGIGPSAHSYNGLSRQYNVANNHLYLKSLEKGEVPFEREVLKREDLINEYILTRLRTHWGCDTAYLKKQYNYDLLVDRHPYVSRLVHSSLAFINDSTLHLTPKGKLLADKIASDLFVVA
jgi:oxygen-independent coproporphyrinogen III oxidase